MPGCQGGDYPVECASQSGRSAVWISAPALGAGGRRFKSGRPDHFRAMYFVYILQSRSTGRFYVGQCNHLIERFHEHLRGVNLATRSRGPWWMPYFEVHPTRTDAIRRERKIKAQKSATAIRRLIGTVADSSGPMRDIGKVAGSIAASHLSFDGNPVVPTKIQSALTGINATRVGRR